LCFSYEDIIIEGDVAALKFVAYYVKDGKVPCLRRIVAHVPHTLNTDVSVRAAGDGGGDGGFGSCGRSRVPAHEIRRHHDRRGRSCSYR
jgi:hypothetical protein